MYTRCPHCETTFRITPEALEMAGGQVRCGRCTQVFDANATLSEAFAGPPRATGEAAAPTRAREAAAGPDAAATAADDDAWLLADDWREEPAAGSGRDRAAWAAAAALAGLLLAGQLAHHFRADLALHETVGGFVQRAYAAVGVTVVPEWDPQRYRIRDWVATANETTDGPPTLLIRAEIENRGSDPLPQPHIYLALKDRWDTVVAASVFAPADYLDTQSAAAMLAPHATTIAELEVVDPGPDAYGFELDVCVPASSGDVRCANEAVFR